VRVKNVSIPRTVMEDVPSDPIGGCENTLSFPGEETSLGRGGFPHIPLREMFHARPALLTVFSTTQLNHSKTHGVYLLSQFWKFLREGHALVNPVLLR
jgi:hypothetical protein